MIPSRLTFTREGRPAFDIEPCVECRTVLRFERVGAETRLVDPDPSGAGVSTDDAWVWEALSAGPCTCRQTARRRCFAPAIPAGQPLAEAVVAERRAAWRRRGEAALADWAAPITGRWGAESADSPLHALGVGLVGITGRPAVVPFLRLCPGGALDILEWARAGVRGADEAAAWIAAGAADAHDAACRSRAGQTPETFDTSRSGCAALAHEWPGSRPATTECARRLGVGAGPAIARLVVALPCGDHLEIYESTRGGEPVLAAVTVDRSGSERPTTRVVLPAPVLAASRA